MTKCCLRSVHLVGSLPMVVLIHIICNGVDIKRTHNFCTWEAPLDCVMHACVTMPSCEMHLICNEDNAS